MKRLILLGAAVFLSACQTTPQQAVNPRTSDDAQALQTRLAESVKTCWFAGDPAFADYIYSPEINANAPRILIAPKKDPGGRPVLVIEPKSATTADVYGPMLASPNGARVRADLGRWLNGATDCSA
ncbi:MAG: hypothetical protein ACXW2F_12920 [Thermoanaerobaculia bacterium]